MIYREQNKWPFRQLKLFVSCTMCLSIARIVHRADRVNVMYMRSHLTYHVNGSEFTAIPQPLRIKKRRLIVAYLKQTSL